MSHWWKDANYRKKVEAAALDGVEECARTVMLTQAKEDCPVAPVNGGTMRNSLGTERDEANQCVYLGGGGAAKAYIYRQEMDRGLNHTSGKAGFIRDSVSAHVGELGAFVKKHIQ
jgi:hypothetical protein